MPLLRNTLYESIEPKVSREIAIDLNVNPMQTFMDSAHPVAY
jgi:hypothetical protein